MKQTGKAFDHLRPVILDVKAWRKAFNEVPQSPKLSDELIKLANAYMARIILLKYLGRVPTEIEFESVTIFRLPGEEYKSAMQFQGSTLGIIEIEFKVQLGWVISFFSIGKNFL